MRLESAGQVALNGRPITSSAGAMGLMQLIPGTYDDMRIRYGLGPDPYDPHDNILAGAAYLREMYEHYGFPNLFAAYHAGPGRLEAALAGGKPLPKATKSYLKSIVPDAEIVPARNQNPVADTLFFMRTDTEKSSSKASQSARSVSDLFMSLRTGAQ
jgi:soluble lytic murein transglycosylase-like protein